MRLIDADALKKAHGMKNDFADCDKELRGKSRSCEFERLYTLMDFCGWLDDAPTIEPERTKYIQDTKAVPSDRDCVDLSEKVTATFYDDEHKEWLQMTVTIRDVLDSVCNSYTVIEPERKTGKWIKKSKRLDFCTEWWYECSECGYKPPNHPNYLTDFCPNCGADMRGEKNEQLSRRDRIYRH